MTENQPEENRMKLNFNEVSVTGTKKWTENGKRRTKTKKFYQTINPFNKNRDGSVKTRSDILVEIMAERKAWLESEPSTESNDS